MWKWDHLKKKKLQRFFCLFLLSFRFCKYKRENTSNIYIKDHIKYTWSEIIFNIQIAYVLYMQIIIEFTSLLQFSNQENPFSVPFFSVQTDFFQIILKT